MDSKATKLGENQLGKQKKDSEKDSSGYVQAISAIHMAKLQTDLGLESDQEQLDMDLLLHLKNDNE